MQSVQSFLENHRAEHVGWRRHLHQWPEVAFEEHRTSAFLAERLAGFGLRVETGLAGTGVVATLEGSDEGPAIGLRADMDALPITEDSGLDYRSGNDGVSHSCGHDGHMTMLLAAAQCLAARRDFPGTLQFIFQPAEEAEGGGRRMVEEGLFEKYPVEAVFGLHNWPGLPLGQVAVRPGAMMAAMDLFSLRVTGSGVHAALPHLGTDAIVGAGALIASLQSIVSRAVNALDPAVVSLTQIHGGNALNALPAEVLLQGTVRALSDAARLRVHARLRQIAAGIAEAHEVGIELEITPAYPATLNDTHAAHTVAAIAAETWGADRVTTAFDPSMASEDFAFMLNARKGCYAWIGSGTDIPLHNPRFDFNDELISPGALYWVRLAQNWKRVSARVPQESPIQLR